MATTSNPLIGNASGSVGGVTMSKWKGINVIKAKPTSVAQPPSQTRTMRQAALSAMVAIYRLISSVINTTYKSLATNMSAYNAFTSYNLKNAFDYTSPPTPTLNPELLLTSKGTIAATAALTAILDVSDKLLTVTYPTSVAGANQSATDRVVVVVYNATKDTWEGAVLATARSAGTAIYTPANTYEALDSADVYFSFVSADGSKASDSVYFHDIIQA